MRQGKRNLITDVAGLWVGQAEDPVLRSGCTVLLGAAPFTPPLPGVERALTLRDVTDVDALAAATDTALTAGRRATVIGAGFIGVEVAENLAERGLSVTLVELADQVLPPLDPEMAWYIAEELIGRGIELRLGTQATAIGEDHVTLSDGTTVSSDLVLLSIGVRPETRLARAAGITIGDRGGVVVDAAMRTNLPQVYAVGDMVEKTDVLTGAAALVPLANVANKQGRRAADAIAGLPVPESSASAHRATAAAWSIAGPFAGIVITLDDARDGKNHHFHYDGGINSFVEHLNKNKGVVHEKPVYMHGEKDGIDAEISLQWNDGYNPQEFSFANNINTHEGGTHLSGFRAALTRTINSYAQKNNLAKDLKDASISGDDIREGMVAVISVKIPRPQFEGQTKTKLGNTEVKGIVEGVVNDRLGAFLEENPAVAKRVVAKAIAVSYTHLTLPTSDLV